MPQHERQTGECVMLETVMVQFCQAYLKPQTPARLLCGIGQPGDIRHPPALALSARPPARHPSSRWKTLHIFVLTSPPQAPLNISAHAAFRAFFKPYDATVFENHRPVTRLLWPAVLTHSLISCLNVYQSWEKHTSAWIL